MGHTGVFLQKLKCVSEESSFFFNNNEQNQMLWRSFKTKKKNKQTQKQKTPKKKLLRIITFKTFIVFSKSVSEKQKYYF